MEQGENIGPKTSLAPILNAIHDRLRKQQELRDLMGLREQTIDEKLFDSITGKPSASAARSEFYVTSDQINHFLDEEVSIARGIILKAGTRWSDDPEIVKNMSEDEEGIYQLTYSYKARSGLSYSMSEDTSRTEEAPWLLSIGRMHSGLKDANVDEFDIELFPDEYEITIHFSDRLKYKTPLTDYSHMTDDELEIIKSLTEDLIDETLDPNSM